jgi:phage tail P2-like protein
MTLVSPLLPPNQSETEAALDLAAQERFDALQGEFALTQLVDVAQCPDTLLPWLAWALRVETWNPALGVAVLRELTANAFKRHRTKGTVAAVKQLLVDLGYGDAVITEGTETFKYDGTVKYDGTYAHGSTTRWAHYLVKIPRPLTIAQADELRGWLRTVTPARCVLQVLDYTEAAFTYGGLQTHNNTITHGTV